MWKLHVSDRAVRPLLPRSVKRADVVAGNSAREREILHALHSSVGNRALARLVRSHAPHGRGCPCDACSPSFAPGRVARALIQRTPSRCTRCGAFFDDSAVQNFCHECLYGDYDYVDELAFCTTRGCANELIALAGGERHGRASGKYCQYCDKPLTAGTQLVALANARDERLSRPERRLKDLIVRVNKYLASSGTHHATGSSGTSAARERHTAADATLATQNREYAADLEKMIAEVEQVNEDSPLLGPARLALSQVRQKRS